MTIIDVTDATFKQEVLESDQTVLVDFWAPWCGPCKMLSPILDEIAAGRDDVKFVKLNAEDYPEIARSIGIMGYPTLLLFNEGKVMSEHLGLATKGNLDKWLNEMTADPTEGITIEEYKEQALEKARQQMQDRQQLKRVLGIAGSVLKTAGGLSAMFAHAAFAPVAGAMSIAFNAVRGASLFANKDGAPSNPYATTSGHIFSTLTNAANAASGVALFSIGATTSGFLIPAAATLFGLYMAGSALPGLFRDAAVALVKVQNYMAGPAQQEQSCKDGVCELPPPENKMT